MDYIPLTSEPWQVQLVVGRDKPPYDKDPGSLAASLLETKLLINNIISDAKYGARFMSLNLKDYFLMTLMDDPEFMKIHIRNFPLDIIEFYKLTEKQTKDGYIYIRIKKGMYGLKQAALLGYQQLVRHLEPHGFHPIKHTEGLWKHK